MHDNSTTSTLTIMDRFRQWVRVQASNVFSPPYLPTALTAFLIITIITQLALILMSQPFSYWQGGPDVKGVALNGDEPPFGPMIMIGGWLIYLFIAILCLSVFNIRWSLIGWLTGAVAHLYGIQYWMETCRLSRWSLRLGAFCQSFDPSSFWFIAAILMGTMLSIYFLPTQPSFANQKIGRLVPRAIIFVPVAWVLMLLSLIIWSARVPTYGWVPIETQNSPGPLQEAKAAYDVKRNRLVLFGGTSGYLGNDRWDFQNDTWEWDGEDWINVSPEKSPEGRTKSGMAYDEERGVVVLFGGVGPSGPLCDTWIWDGKLWERKYPLDCPSARYGHEMYYDTIRKRVVLYGGYNNTNFFNDAWEWDGNNWAKLELEGDSPTASVYSLAYNVNENYAFGLLSGWMGGTWTFKDNTWTHLFPDIEPSNRGWTGLAYDPRRKIFVTFGGISKETVLNDTWLFDGENWSLYTESRFQPSIRSDHIIWYDYIRERVMIFGGHNGSEIFNDTWELILPEE